MTPDPSHVERKSSWRDEHLECICGLANGRGGVLEIGREVRREAIGVTDLLRLADEIPDKVRSVLSIVVNVHVRSDRGRDYLRIVVPPHPERVSHTRAPDSDAIQADDDRTRPGRSARKQPDDLDQPENSQKVGDRILAFLRENPSASRREIAGALAGATEGSVRYRLDKLKEVGRLRRVGPDRGGRWEVIEDADLEASEHNDGGAAEHRDRGNAQSAISQNTTRKLPEDHQKTAGYGHPSPESALLSDRILSLLRRNPSASRREIAAALGTTRSTVRYRLDRLREAGRGLSGWVPTTAAIGGCWTIPPPKRASDCTKDVPKTVPTMSRSTEPP